MSLGESIRTFRNIKKMSRKELGERIERSQHSIKKYELGEVTPSLEVIEDIAKALGIERWDLIVGSKEGKTKKEYREEAVNNIIDDFITLAKKFSYDIFQHGKNEYIVSSSESDDELMISKEELLAMRDNVMAYTKFTLDYSFENLNDGLHQSPLEDVNIVEDGEEED